MASMHFLNSITAAATSFSPHHFIKYGPYSLTRFHRKHTHCRKVSVFTAQGAPFSVCFAFDPLALVTPQCSFILARSSLAGIQLRTRCPTFCPTMPPHAERIAMPPRAAAPSVFPDILVSRYAFCGSFSLFILVCSTFPLFFVPLLFPGPSLHNDTRLFSHPLLPRDCLLYCT
jgi:hypothetical protein